jgi:hypothetical protein
VPSVSKDCPIGVRAIGDPVVGHDALDLDALSGEDSQGSRQSRSCTRAGLVRNLDHDRSPAPVIDDDFEMVVAEAFVARCNVSSKSPVTAPVGDPPELLVILMDETAWMTDLVAADRQACRSVDVGQARHVGSAQDSRDGRGRVAKVWTEPIRTPAQLVPGAHDPLDFDGRRRSR